jgi:hypothetical protein
MNDATPTVDATGLAVSDRLMAVERTSSVKIDDAIASCRADQCHDLLFIPLDWHHNFPSERSGPRRRHAENPEDQPHPDEYGHDGTGPTRIRTSSDEEDADASVL